MNETLLDRARVVLEHALDVGSGDELVLLTDGSVDRSVVEAFDAAGWALGATVMRLTYSPLEVVAMREFGIFAAASLDPRPRLPRPVVQALAAADAAVIVNSDMSIMFDAGPRAVISSGATKLGWAPYLSEDAALRLLPASAGGCVELSELTTAMSARFGGDHEVLVTSPVGTKLRLRIGEHRVNCGTGVASSGAGYGGLQIWPGGQVSTAPNRHSAHGTLVIDRSVNAPRYSEIATPIELRVDGYVVEVTGSTDAAELRAWLASLDDPEAYHLTELGVGTNARCHFAGVAAPCEDTHTLGWVSLALGADEHLGGEVAAPCHIDMTMRRASLLIDDRPVVVDGELRA